MKAMAVRFPVWWLAAAAVTSAAPLQPLRPYAADAETLHLWHLDESAPPFADAGSSPTALLGALNGVTGGHAGFPGLGKAVSLRHPPAPQNGYLFPYGPILLAKPGMEDGKDNVDAPFPFMGKDGQFTIEALIKLDTLPGDAPGLALDIVTMDADEVDQRSFLFRIEKPGFLSFLPLSGNTVVGGGLATIPTTGPHAVDTESWFHVAVAYDGKEGSVNNLKFYWTKLGAGGQGANLVGRGTLVADLKPTLGDFALGNSGKEAGPYGPWEFLPGLIDEVRISSVERGPYDFLFVEEAARVASREGLNASVAPPPPVGLGMELQRIKVDGSEQTLPSAGKALELAPGLHRIDFDFDFQQGAATNPLSVRCRLEGLEEEWQPSARGMSMEWEMLDEAGNTLGRRVFTVTGSSSGWTGEPVASPLNQRLEPVFIPEHTRKIRVALTSGPPDTTGVWFVNGIHLRRAIEPGTNLWEDGELKEGERMSQITGIPYLWERQEGDYAVARIMQWEKGRSLGLIDAEQTKSGGWATRRDLGAVVAAGGETFIAGWSESFSVIPGAAQRASYSNVPPGSYVFRAIALGGGPDPSGSQLALKVTVHPPYWQRPWFIPLMVAAGVLAAAGLFFAIYRSRARRRMAVLELQHAVERDRARIARDMHDDLGTRVSVLNLAASFVSNSMEREPEKARRHLQRLETASRDLAQAMHSLVWAVNPANDTLDHLASHLSASAQEIYTYSAARLRISIPEELPRIPLKAEFRHHFALGVKETLHNALKHAGPCDVSFRLFIEGRDLVAEISDDGIGFDTEKHREGNGLHNLHARFNEIGGVALVRSSPGKGTRAVLRCPLPQVSAPAPALS